MTTPDTRPSSVTPERLLELAQDLLGIDTQNPPGETREIITRVETFFENLGLTTRRIATDPAKPNLLATLPGDADQTLLYNGHVDTVPFDDSRWTRDPLGERDGDRLYGRGATDMKGPLAAMLHTAEAFVETDTEPPVTLVFAVVSDEETGGEAGVSTLLARDALSERRPGGCVIGETTCSAGRHSVTVADRGSIWLTLESSGTSAHGSRPLLGQNAIDNLWGAITRLRTSLSTRSISIPADVEPIIDESVGYYEPTVGRSDARDLFEYPTVNLGTIEGGKSINTVPDTARAELDVRLTAGIETSTVLADIRDCLRDHPAVSVADVGWSVGTHERIDSPLVEAVTSTASDAVGDRIYRRSATGGGDAKKFRQAGIPTVEFALGTDTVHAADEYTTVEALTRNAAVYTRLPAVWKEATRSADD